MSGGSAARSRRGGLTCQFFVKVSVCRWKAWDQHRCSCMPRGCYCEGSHRLRCSERAAGALVKTAYSSRFLVRRLFPERRRSSH